MRRFTIVVVCLSAFACKAEAPAPAWRPGVVYASPGPANARGLLDRRGLIHAHSMYSHDACDNEPVKDGKRDAACLADFRRGLCQVQHDFVFLTDHSDAFEETEFPETLLYRPDSGDTLVQREGDPVASWLACPDGRRALIMAGTESGTMAVRIPKHLGDAAQRRAVYRQTSAEAIATLKAAGAVVLLAHTEDWTPEQLLELPIHGFEMYNLHANALRAPGNVLDLVVTALEHPEELPYPDLILLAFLSEDPRYLETWGTVLARGAQRVTTMGTDCHQNSFPGILPDGERGDSYRRMMGWFSNHLLVRPEADGSFDDRHLVEALEAGRLYGVLEVLGYAEGFDFHAEVGAAVVEMGGEAAVGAKLVVRAPRLAGGDSDPAPRLTVRILRAVEGGFEEVKSGSGDLEHSVTTPGAYRAEVRMVPHHVRDQLGRYRADIMARDFAWVYSNPIYVR